MGRVKHRARDTQIAAAALRQQNRMGRRQAQPGKTRQIGRSGDLTGRARTTMIWQAILIAQPGKIAARHRIGGQCLIRQRRRTMRHAQTHKAQGKHGNQTQAQTLHHGPVMPNRLCCGK